MKRQPPTSRRGFTLIELLVTITIIAMLAALGFLAMQYAMNKAREKDTVALIDNIGRAIEDYKDDHGNYPRPAEAEATTVVSNETWVVGGAKMLYQVLSGDGTDAMLNGEKISNGEQGSAKDEKDPSLGKIYMETIKAPTKKMREEKKPEKYVDAGEGDTFFVVDPWRHPLRYQVPERDKNGVVKDDIKFYSSGAFELWSYGMLKKPGDTEEDQKKWLTNWGKK
jgi:prepilin-type N-terminal cleavage/methylation domain-containing protein